VAVMYAGRVVEEGPVAGLMAGPLHPYAQGLLGATVHAGMRGQRLTTIPGAPPTLDVAPTNCAFAPRCPQVRDECLERVPSLRQPEPGRRARCVLLPQ